MFILADKCYKRLDFAYPICEYNNIVLPLQTKYQSTRWTTNDT